MDEKGEGRERSEGNGDGEPLRWNRRALLNYTQCRTGKGKLVVWTGVQCRRID